MRAVSLFSGVGGIDLAFDMAGIETVLQAESDPWALSVLERHWPNVERVKNVRQVDAAALRGRCGDVERDGHGSNAERLRAAGAHGRNDSYGVDLVYGGWPCQGNSVAGKRGGLSDERSGLWFEVRRVLSELRPRWFVGENVPGLLSVNRGLDWLRVLMDLDDLGYGVAWRTLDARFFGVPQRRRRVFVVGCLGDAASAAQVLAFCSGCGGHPATSKGAWQGSAPAAANGTGVAGTLGVHRGNIRADQAWTGQLVEGNDPAAFGGNNTSGPIELATTRSSKANRYDFETDTFLANNAGVRRLTPLETERLQAFPDGWTEFGADGARLADSHRYRLTGNAVATVCAQWIGHRLVAVDAMKREREA